MLERTTLHVGLHKPIRSFVERKGRIAPAHKPLIEQLWPKFGLGLSPAQLEPAQIFGREAPRTLEIGFGDGRAMLEHAKNHPEQDFLGIEVYKAGVAKLLVGIHQHKLTNIRVFCADAVEVLNNCLPDACLNQVQLFFPDPWPKARHHKRRIVQPEFIQLLAQKLKLGGTMHMATDWNEYALHMLEVMESQPGWINIAGKGQYITRPVTRPLTKFEQRGHRLGYQVWDLIFIKNN